MLFIEIFFVLVYDGFVLDYIKHTRGGKISNFLT